MYALYDTDTIIMCILVCVNVCVCVHVYSCIWDVYPQYSIESIHGHGMVSSCSLRVSSSWYSVHLCGFKYHMKKAHSPMFSGCSSSH